MTKEQLEKLAENTYPPTGKRIDIHRSAAINNFKRGALAVLEEYKYTEQDMQLAHQAGAAFAYGRKEATRDDRNKDFTNFIKHLKNLDSYLKGETDPLPNSENPA
jgi:hypothetical protein